MNLLVSVHVLFVYKVVLFAGTLFCLIQCEFAVWLVLGCLSTHTFFFLHTHFYLLQLNWAKQLKLCLHKTHVPILVCHRVTKNFKGTYYSTFNLESSFVIFRHVVSTTGRILQHICTILSQVLPPVHVSWSHLRLFYMEILNFILTQHIAWSFPPYPVTSSCMLGRVLSY